MEVVESIQTLVEMAPVGIPSDLELAALFQFSLEMLCIASGDGYFKRVNPAFERILGYSAEELLSRPFLDFVHPEDLERTRQELNKLIEGRPTIHFENRYRCRDGTYRWLSWKAAPQDGGDRIYAAASDVTLQKQAEAGLRDSEERFELAVRGTDAGIWDWDIRANRVYYSSRWKSMLGFADHEIGAEFHEWTERIHPEDSPVALATIHEYLCGHRPEYEVEHRLRHKDGTYRWIFARGAAVCDASGKPYRMVGSHIDVTDRKRAEETVRENLAQLVAARKIQQHLLPGHPPDLPGFNIAGASYPADFAAGDHFDFLPMPDRCIGFVVADVAGHGIGPAILMASVHAHLHSLAAALSDPEEILNRANSILVNETEPERFVTLFFLRLDPHSRTLTYASAGHPTAYVLDKFGEVRAALPSSAFPLGVAADVRFPTGDPVTLQPGDLVLMFTDGLPDAICANGNRLGHDRILQVVARERGKSAQEILDAIYKSVNEFSGGRPPSDDVTVVVIKVELDGT